jgi:hypothetical protein
MFEEYIFSKSINNPRIHCLPAYLSGVGEKDSSLFVWYHLWRIKVTDTPSNRDSSLYPIDAADLCLWENPQGR